MYRRTEILHNLNLIKYDHIRPLQIVQENIVVHLQWENSYYIVHYPHPTQDTTR